MHNLFYAVILGGCVTASHAKIKDPYLDVVQDPMLREQYLRRLEALAFHSHALKRSSLSALDTAPPPLLPGGHLKVEKALNGMEGEVQELKQRQSLANAAQGKLRGTVSEAISHMGDASKIKLAIAQKQALLRNEEHKESVLQDNMQQIEQTHSKLLTSLHQNMDPNLDYAQARLKKRQGALQSEIDDVKYWGDQVKQANVVAKEAIIDDQVTHKRLVELQEQLSWRQQQQGIAARKAEYDEQMVNEDMRSLQYAQGQYDAEVVRLRSVEERLREVEQSVHDEDNIRSMERMEDARHAVHAEADEAQNWKDNAEHIGAEASEMMKHNETSQAALLEIQAQVAWTKQQRRLAEKQYKLKQEMASEEVSNLKVVETKYKAEVSKLKAAESATRSADESLVRLDAIRTKEEQKIKQHLVVGKSKLQSKLKNAEISRERTVAEIASLERQLASWKQEQQQRSQDVAKVKQASATASQELAVRQQEAFGKAQAKVYEAEIASSDSEWGREWAKEPVM